MNEKRLLVLAAPAARPSSPRRLLPPLGRAREIRLRRPLEVTYYYLPT